MRRLYSSESQCEVTVPYEAERLTYHLGELEHWRSVVHSATRGQTAQGPGWAELPPRFPQPREKGGGNRERDLKEGAIASHCLLCRKG